MLLFLSWCILTGWKSLDDVSGVWRIIYDEVHFFLSATVLPFFVSIIIFIAMICGVNKRVERGNWILAVSTKERGKILFSVKTFEEGFTQNH